MRSKFRSKDTQDAKGNALPYDTALFLIKDSVDRRKSLIYGRLDDDEGNHCALGCFWDDNPKAVLNTSLIDEVAAVNDSVPPNASPQQRWKKVSGWLRFKIKSLSVADKRNSLRA
jgi:hypothetical protein